ncbi:transporter [Flavobacteriaceae bacterium]|nr:transporter [Flavobacteriaceae bacterium]
MKINISFFLLILNCFLLNSQYTEIINSNRPGSSQGAFSVGKNVLQIETGFKSSDFKNNSLNQSTISENKISYTLRYGILLNKLEVFIDGSYNKNEINDFTLSPVANYKESTLGKQTLGFKYLVYDPFKNKKWHSVNLLSWKKNRTIKLVDFIPAISIYTGINYKPKNSYSYDYPFTYITSEDEKDINSKIGIITQNHFLGKWVLVNNFTLDRLGDPNYIFNYQTTLTHNFKNFRWSSFIEYEIIKNKVYSDNYYKFGVAYLLNKDFQIDTSFGFNHKKTPSNLNINLGISTRFDWYKDEVPVDKKELKTNKKKSNKNKIIIKKDFKLIRKQDKINKRFDKKEKRLIKKNNRNIKK